MIVDVDLSKPIHDYILVEREGFTFHVGVIHEKLHVFRKNCQTVGNNISHCNELNHGKKMLHTISRINIKLKRQWQHFFLRESKTNKLK
jgi:hypothetical protein